jgi:hypothetical protein
MDGREKKAKTPSYHRRKSVRAGTFSKQTWFSLITPIGLACRLLHKKKKKRMNKTKVLENGNTESGFYVPPLRTDALSEHRKQVEGKSMIRQYSPNIVYCSDCTRYTES